ncbi:Deoxycytidylate deaminase [Chryseobacterium oranimense]|uniref:Deoxycytidylate deaminase n=1 Tax=Chryseobacterium oranimense TaxID=421058 RepID=A0A1M5KAN3_9FLAO|nr:hypothetical protein [Chryseobacterium oranimense]SHG49827.1 Deoxycytidylate deaminase [Chryseobacterium oranimense]
MDVNKLYELRSNFIIIGLTGRMRGGANQLTEILCNSDNPFTNDNLKTEIDFIKSQNLNEGLKNEILCNFINFNNGTIKNWNKFELLEYKKVIFFNFLFDCYKEEGDFLLNIPTKIIQLGSYRNFEYERFGSTIESTNFILEKVKVFFNETNVKTFLLTFNFSCETLKECLQSKNSKEIYDFFFHSKFTKITSDFFSLLDSHSLILRQRFIQSLSLYYRLNGRININEIVNIDKKINEGKYESSLEHIYTIAETINRLIKAYRDVNDNKCNIIIDSLKNSFEVNFFKERFSGFYLVTVNKKEKTRIIDIENKVKSLYLNDSEKADKEFKENKNFDDKEYRTDDFKNGLFSSPDVENCIQKSDYHIFIDDDNLHNKNIDAIMYKEDSDDSMIHTEHDEETLNKGELKNYFTYKSLELQSLKLICLIKQPGLITPSSIERIMNIAFNAKLNSGCISRQVGAVVTDSSFSVKAIGWNEVPEGQTPCSLRNIYDLKNDKNLSAFTNYEKSNTIVGTYRNGKTFKQNATENLAPEIEILDKLQERSCSFCFKEFHNSFEGEKNQVHTRSLHAEENAMLQITKYGGQPLKGGNLFTTASPCELCSKKAFQLGVKNIFYIDPYPGIAKTQILGGGNISDNNPNLFMFQGAIGKGFNKLYEPFMSIKDETKIRSNIRPLKVKPKQKDLDNMLAEFTTEEVVMALDRINRKKTDGIIDFSKTDKKTNT